MEEVSYVVPPDQNVPKVTNQAPKVPKSPPQPSKVGSWVRSHIVLSIALVLMGAILILISTVMITGKQISILGLNLNPLVNKANCPAPQPGIDGTDTEFITCGGGGGGGIVVDPVRTLAIEGNFDSSPHEKQLQTVALTVTGNPQGICAWTISSMTPTIPDAKITTINGGPTTSATYTGTPPSIGDYSINIKVDCGKGQSATKTFSFIVLGYPIDPPADPPADKSMSVTAEFPDGKVNEAYNTRVQSVNASSGGIYTCKVGLSNINPAMPSAKVTPGTKLGTDGQVTGTFSATPTTPGTYTVTLNVSCNPTNSEMKIKSLYAEKDFKWKVTGTANPGGSTGGAISKACTDPSIASKLTPIYRWWKGSDKDHFYTTIANEKPTGYKYEGIAGYVFKEKVAGTTAIYRSYKFAITAHYYSTVDDASDYGYTNEGILGYAYANTATEAVPWSRLHKGWPDNDYIETINSVEKSAALAAGFADEGTVANICGPDKPI